MNREDGGGESRNGGEKSDGGHVHHLALLMDCDGTLARDTTTLLVKKVLGGPSSDARGFWAEVTKLEREGWDGPLVWIPKLLSLAEAQGVSIDESWLTEAATEIDFWPGVPDIFIRLRQRVEAFAERNGIKATLGVHVISGGLEDLLVRSKLESTGAEVYGCLLDFDPSSRKATRPKSIVTFTEKTKFVFAIHKGISKDDLRADPKKVNEYMPRSKRPVPFNNMVYVGDGPTDVPCFSMISQLGGTAVGIRQTLPEGETTWDNALPGEEILVNYRPRWGPFDPDYSDGTPLAEVLTEIFHDRIVRCALDPGLDDPQRRSL